MKVPGRGADAGFDPPAGADWTSWGLFPVPSGLRLRPVLDPERAEANRWRGRL